MTIAVGKAEICIQGPGNAVIRIAQTAAPYMFAFEEAEKIIVMNAVIGDQGNIMSFADALAQMQTGYGQGIVENFHMVDPGKGYLLRQVFPGHFSPYRIEEGIGRIFPHQDAPAERGKEAEVGAKGQDR